jgi:pimeloyl-ACP methyl ester carboxylesterase
VLGGIKSGFLHLLNYTTYYLMKARAGDVGSKGVAPLLVKVRQSRADLRVHIIGHSFGCRVVAAALNTLPAQEQFRVDTVLLLQGAFSHNGFAQKGDQTDRGAFRDVIEKKKVRGPIVITHTRNDKAVGTAYPIASRISGVNAAELGDANDIYGGLGSNGTQTKDTTPERIVGTLLAVGQTYPFASGVKASTPCNLKADEFIKGHSDIRKPEVAYVLTVAMTAPVSMTAPA